LKLKEETELATLETNTIIAENSRENEKIVKVSENKTNTDIRQKELDTKKRTELATFETNAIIAENSRENEKIVKIYETKTNTDIKQKELEAKKRIEVATFESKTVAEENTQQESIVISNAKLAVTRAEQEKTTQIAKINSQKDSELRDIELTEKNNQAKVKVHVEELKSKILAEATVQALATLEATKAQAEATKLKADADNYKKLKDADAEIYEKTKQAQATETLYNSQAKGIEALRKAFGNDNNTLLAYMMIQNNQFVEIAKQSAQAINGLNPKITIWNTGDNNKNGNMSATDLIKDITKCIPPLFGTIQEQTGIKIFPSIIENTVDKLK